MAQLMGATPLLLRFKLEPDAKHQRTYYLPTYVSNARTRLYVLGNATPKGRLRLKMTQQERRQSYVPTQNLRRGEFVATTVAVGASLSSHLSIECFLAPSV